MEKFRVKEAVSRQQREKVARVEAKSFNYCKLPMDLPSRLPRC